MRNLLLLTSLICFTTSPLFSQKKTTKKVKDTIDTEVINVVTSYNPTISDAFKAKSNPVISDDPKFSKQILKYSIFSVPVASTFTPKTGVFKGVKLPKKEQVYNNHVSAGYGNYATPKFEAFIQTSGKSKNNFGGYLNYIATEGGIPNAILSTKHSKAQAGAFYKQREKKFNWEAFANLNRQTYNWYGLPENITFDQNILDAIREKQSYLNIEVGGKVNLEDSYMNKGDLTVNYFSDKFNSNEIAVSINPELIFPALSDDLKLKMSLDYLNGNFQQDYHNTSSLKHSFLTIGTHPTYKLASGKKFSATIGAKGYYSFDTERNIHTFYAYPDITLSYKIVNEVLNIYAGANGELHQNSYAGFVDQNPFVSPTLTIQQTDEQYNTFIGFSGKLATNINFNLKGSYKNENNKALFIRNFPNPVVSEPVYNAYRLGNSFRIIYDNVRTVNIFAELSANITEELELKANVEYNHFTLDTQIEPWNLPNVRANIQGNYQTKKWYAGSKVYFVSDRKDLETPTNLLIPPTIITNKAYTDINLNGGYFFTDRITTFINLNNILGNHYERYTGYAVQGFQVLGGVSYKFDL